MVGKLKEAFKAHTMEKERVHLLNIFPEKVWLKIGARDKQVGEGLSNALPYLKRLFSTRKREGQPPRFQEKLTENAQGTPSVETFQDYERGLTWVRHHAPSLCDDGELKEESSTIIEVSLMSYTRMRCDPALLSWLNTLGKTYGDALRHLPINEAANHLVKEACTHYAARKTILQMWEHILSPEFPKAHLPDLELWPELQAFVTKKLENVY